MKDGAGVTGTGIDQYSKQRMDLVLSGSSFDEERIFEIPGVVVRHGY